MNVKKLTDQQILRVLDVYESRLEKRAGVVGMGIVRLDREEWKTKGSTRAIAVYVRKKIPENELSPKDVIPPYLKMDVGGRIVDVPTKVIEQGDVCFQSVDEKTSLGST